MRNPKVPSQKNSGLTSRKNQAKKGAATAAEPVPPLLDQRAAVILHQSLARLTNCTVLGTIDSLGHIRELLHGYPALKDMSDVMKEVHEAYNDLHRLCAQVDDAILKREHREDFDQKREDCVWALWIEVIEPALRWKVGRHSSLLYSFGPELHCAAALTMHNPYLKKETAAMLRLACAIDALETFDDAVETISNPPAHPPEPSQRDRTALQRAAPQAEIIVNFWAPADLVNLIDQAALKHGMDRCEFVRCAVREKLAKGGAI